MEFTDQTWRRGSAHLHDACHSSILRDVSNYENADIDALADVLKALSNHHRLRIFLKLATCCVGRTCCDAGLQSVGRCVGDLGVDLGLAASTVSHHLKELRRAGLIHVERRGQKVECWASDKALVALRDFFSAVCSARANVEGSDTVDAP